MATSNVDGGTCVVLLIKLVLAVALGLCFSAAWIGMTGAVFLESPFMYGWHRAWERWGWLIVWWLFVFGSFTGSRKA